MEIVKEGVLRDSVLNFWVEQVENYEKEAKNWEPRAKKIIKIYKNSRGETDRKATRFNILWSNVQTLHPALYSGTPVPNVDRRFEDDEEVNTTVAQILERSVSYFVRTNDFDDSMSQVVLDRLLSGRGTVWVRYMPHFKDVKIQGNDEVKQEGLQVTDDVNTGDDSVAEELYSEDVVLDYVHWCDFGHCVARTWQENRAVWRRVYMTRKEMAARFGDEKARIVPLDAKPLGKSDNSEDESDGKRACIYELWDRVTKKAFWFHKDLSEFLDQKDDPLELSGFFPCPKPLYSTLANDSLIPTPDYTLYQDQAYELDMLTARIDALNKALKVVGVYDSDAEGVQRMLSENVDNKLIPVEQWAVFAEKGGIKGVVDFMPIDMVGEVLISLYDAREKIKQDIYEITGISDIIRGQTNASETATAQQIKGQFATLRLDNMQKDVARFSRDCVRIMTEIIAEHFSVDTLKQVSGVRLLTMQEKQQVQMLMQAQQQGLQVPPVPEITMKLMEKPTWEEIEAVLRDKGARCFRVDIETDSTIKADQEAEKAARIEFLTSAGGFIQQAAQIPVPELQPLLMEMLKFGVSGFKAGRELEAEFKTAMDGIKKKAEQPPAPVEDPMAAQAAADSQMKQAEMQGKMQIEAAKLQSADAQAQMDAQFKQSDLALRERELALREAELAIQQQEIAAKLELEREKMQADLAKVRMQAKAAVSEDVAMTDSDFNEGLSPLLLLAQQMREDNAATQQALQMIAQSNQAIMQAITAPREVVTPDGRKFTSSVNDGKHTFSLSYSPVRGNA
jgi:hypothetical protein